jgi:hypothetical protein
MRDRLKATELLARTHGAFIERVEGSLDLRKATDEELLSKAAAIIERGRDAQRK